MEEIEDGCGSVMGERGTAKFSEQIMLVMRTESL